MDHDCAFWSQFPLVRLSQWSGLRGPLATWYQHGDFISPHDDQSNNRALSFVLSLTERWENKLGAALWWLGGSPRKHIPEFNTMHLFVPTPKSVHMVGSCVQPPPGRDGGGEGGDGDDDSRRRLAISGWFETQDTFFKQRMEADHDRSDQGETMELAVDSAVVMPDVPVK